MLVSLIYGQSLFLSDLIVEYFDISHRPRFLSSSVEKTGYENCPFYRLILKSISRAGSAIITVLSSSLNEN